MQTKLLFYKKLRIERLLRIIDLLQRLRRLTAVVMVAIVMGHIELRYG